VVDSLVLQNLMFN